MSYNFDTIIVGGGVFGQTIAAALRGIGQQVFLIDSRDPHSGSRPSGGLIKPGWYSSLPRADYERALATVEALWGLHTEHFKVGIGPVSKMEPVHRVDVAQVLAGMVAQHGRATVVEPHMVEFEAAGTKAGASARNVIVAAGVWSGELVKSLRLKGKAGVSYVWRGQLKVPPFIRAWAPYRQLVAFNQSPGEIWVGDGTAVLESSWREEHDQKALARCSQAVGLPGSFARRQWGIRPYIDGRKVAQLEKIDGVWVATGGGKTGMLGAGLCAAQAVEALQ